MVANNDFFTLIAGLALGLVGLGLAVSRSIRLVRLLGLAALAYGVYMILAVTKTIR
jgi:hypothetical protein